jgi:antitoxin (DNA-binding transcriptional repressor) of toxin-antitoxin stability system
MKTATVRDLRNNFARLSVWIDAGQEIQITKRGEVIGTFVPTKKPARKRKRFDAEAHRKWMRATYGDKVFPGNIVVEMRNEKDW